MAELVTPIDAARVLLVAYLHEEELIDHEFQEVADWLGRHPIDGEKSAGQVTREMITALCNVACAAAKVAVADTEHPPEVLILGLLEMWRTQSKE